MTLETLLSDESLRNDLFPISTNDIFMAHAGVSALPRTAVEALQDFIHMAVTDNQEGDWTWEPRWQARYSKTKTN